MRILLSTLGALIVLACPQAIGQIRTVAFDNPNVPPGHDPQAGGLLNPLSQNFQEDGMHVEGFWVRNNETEFEIGHFHHADFGYETSHGFETIAGLGQDLQGLYIKREEGGTFDLLGLDYMNVHGIAQNVMVATSLDLSQPWWPQFTQIPVGAGMSWQTVDFTQFQDITEVWLIADIGLIPNHHFRWDNVRCGIADNHAEDDFDSSSLSGGTGNWDDTEWTTSGQVNVGRPPIAELRTSARIKATGSMTRTVAVATVVNPRLSLEVMAFNYEGLDEAELKVSVDGVNYITLQTFTDANAGGGVFHEFSFDLSGLPPTSLLDIAICTSTDSPAPDYLFIDNIVLRGVDDGGMPPVAVTGNDRMVFDATGSGGAAATLDGSASFDPDGIIVDYTWSTEAAGVLGTGPVLPVVLPYGNHVVTLTVTDDTGVTGTNEVHIYSTPGTIAEDSFESGDFFGGSGSWVGPWATVGPTLVGGGFVNSGIRVSRITNSGSIARLVDTTNLSHARLSLWYKVAQYESGDEAFIEVSTDGGATYTTIHHLTSADSDKMWHFLDLDLGPFIPSPNLVIRMRSVTVVTDPRDYIHFDEVMVHGHVSGP